MGRVKELWEQERQDKSNRRVKRYMANGYTEDEAASMAQDEQEDEDEASGQFGAGA